MSKEIFTQSLLQFCEATKVQPLVCICISDANICSFYNVSVPQQEVIKALRTAADNLENDLPADIKLHFN